MGMTVRALVAASVAQERRLDVLANNLANVDTIGFKARRPLFSMVPFPQPPGVSSPPVQSASIGTSLLPEGANLLQFGMGLKMTGVKTDFKVGNLVMTGNPLDLALNSPGFFVLETPKGLRYTRNGSFTLNAEKVLVNQNGFPVMGQRGPITIEGNRFSFDQTGKLTVKGKELDTLRIVDFKNKDKDLRKDIAGTFTSRIGAEPQEPERIDLRATALERSNVEIVKSMTEMIEIMRAYEAYNKVVQTINETTQRAATEVGRLK